MPFRADPWLHVIAGCMSSGKTDELLRLLRRAEVARRRDEPGAVLNLARQRDADLVGIEEAQFFDERLVEVALALRESGRHVIISGLNLDFAGRPFGPMPLLLAHADEITTLTAICVVCGEVATRTQRLVGGRPATIDDPLVVIGGFDQGAIETYEARCLRHHEVGPPRRREVADAGDGDGRTATGVSGSAPEPSTGGGPGAGGRPGAAPTA